MTHPEIVHDDLQAHLPQLQQPLMHRRGGGQRHLLGDLEPQPSLWDPVGTQPLLDLPREIRPVELVGRDIDRDVQRDGAGLFQPLKIPAGLLDEQKAQLVEEMILPRQRDHQGRVKEAGGWMLPP